jgi:hypothetical protein
MITSERRAAVAWRYVALAALAGGSIGVRYWGISFGLPHTETRPDESRVLNLAIRIAAGDLNPHYFVYPTLYMYLVAALIRLQAGAAVLAHVDVLRRADLFVTARCLTAAFGSATVLLIYTVGKRMVDEGAGLIAAALFAFAFLHVRDSHFGTTDVPMTCGIVFAFLTLLRSGEGRWRLAAAGLAIGLATSIKYNAILLTPVALYLEMYRALEGRRSWREIVPRGALFVACVVAGFLAGTPFALLDWRTFSDGLIFAETYLRSGHVHDGQRLATSHAAWYYASFVLPVGVGWPTWFGGLLGLVLLAVRKPKEGIACLIFVAVYFATAASGLTAFARYMVPLTPFLCLGAAYAIRQCVQPIRDPRLRTIVAGVIAAGCIVPAAVKVVRLDQLLSTPDSRLVVSSWAIEHVEAGRSIWQSGSSFGKVQFLPPPQYVEWLFDDAAGTFTRDGRPVEGFPDYIFIQQSPLRLYSVVPPAIPAILNAHYRVVQTFRTGLTSMEPEQFDASDAFFLPLNGLERIRRPGPEFDVYERIDLRAGRADAR